MPTPAVHWAELVAYYVSVCSVSPCATMHMPQAPVLPYLVDSLGASGSMQYARLQTAFSAIQFIGGLVSGELVLWYPASL